MLVMTNYAENYASTIYQSLNSGRGVHFSKVSKETGDTLGNYSFTELVRAKENEPILLLSFKDVVGLFLLLLKYKILCHFLQLFQNC